MAPATGSRVPNLKCLKPPQKSTIFYTYCFRCVWDWSWRMPRLHPQKTSVRLKETKWMMVFPSSPFTTTTTVWYGVYIHRNCIEKPNQVPTLDPKNIVQWKCAVGGARWIEIKKVKERFGCAHYFSYELPALCAYGNCFSGGTSWMGQLCPDCDMNISKCKMKVDLFFCFFFCDDAEKSA